MPDSIDKKNAPRGFQFSLRQLMISIALFALSIGVWQVPLPEDVFQLPILALYLLISLASVGAAVGIFFGRAIQFALLALLGALIYIFFVAVQFLG